RGEMKYHGAGGAEWFASAYDKRFRPYSEVAMSSSIDPQQRVEVRDAAGQIVGYVILAAGYTPRPANGQPTQPPPADQADSEKRCRELKEKCEKLRKELSQVRAERDEYQANLYRLVPPMTEEELREIERDGVTFDVILADIKNLATGNHLG